MKKNFLLVLVLFLMLIPISVFAEVKHIVKEDYKSMNLEETLAEEEIKQEFSNYSENDNQITIYLFRGKGCAYCKKFLNYLNSITDEYGKYFKLESYEVWRNKKNSKLLDEISDFLDEDAGGVPYIIIGDTVFPGYAEQYNSAIEQTIKELYNSENRYDVFEAMAEEYERQNKVDYSQEILVITINSMVVIVATIIILVYTNNKNKELNSKLDDMKKFIISEKEVTKTTKKLESKSKKTTKSKINTKNE